MKPQREWFLRVPWGKMSLRSYGHPDGEPVFLVHGRQDSLSIFEPLVEQMSYEFYYVALDMPGNGLSDAFPHGPKLQRFHFLYAMELAILHLGWDKFIFMGHSMGCEQGLFFNVIYPGRITRMILLDPGPTLMRMQVEDNEEYQKMFYDHYYENYKRECFSRKKYSFKLAKQTIMRTRELTEDQCAHLLLRNFKELEDNYGSHEQLPNGHSIEAEGPNNGPNSKTEQAPNRAQNVTKAEVENEAQKANEKDYESQNAFEAAKEYEALDRPLNEYYQRQISNGPPTLGQICRSSVDGRKVKAARKANEAQNAIRARKAIEARNLIRARRARDADEPRNVDVTQNADELRNADDAHNADGVEILPGAEDFISSTEPMHNDDAVGGIYRSCPNFEMGHIDGAHSLKIARIGYYQHQNSNGPSANAEDAGNTEDVGNAEDAENAEEAGKAEHDGNSEDAGNAEEAGKAEHDGNADYAQNADDVERPLGPESFINFIHRMRNDDAAGYLSWDNRLKNLAPQNYGNDYYFELFKKIPPTLLVAASNGAKNVPPNLKWRQGAKELLDKMATLENFHRVDVEGGHDIHYTHPERVLPYINAFLKDNKVSSKL